MSYSDDIVCACSEVVMKSVGKTTKVRSKILLIKDNCAYAVCKSCGTEVSVPLELKERLPVPGPRLILRN